MAEIRHFECLIGEKGRDDFGGFTSTFEVDQIIKGNIYKEHQKDNKPNGYIIDDNACWRDIDDMIKEGILKEITIKNKEE